MTQQEIEIDKKISELKMQIERDEFWLWQSSNPMKARRRIRDINKAKWEIHLLTERSNAQ